MIITIDGPAASGKSSVARALAKKLDFFYLNTGMLYRAVAVVLQTFFNKKIDVEGGFIVHEHELLFIKDIVYNFDQGTSCVLYKGQDITVLLSDAQVGQLASILGANAEVRQALLKIQRDVAARYDIVTDGRDCGSVVFPDAGMKFFLTASVQVRAERMVADVQRKAENLDLARAQEEIVQRDKRDMERSVAPLVIPKGATVIDNSGMTLEQTVDLFLQNFRSKFGKF